MHCVQLTDRYFNPDDRVARLKTREKLSFARRASLIKMRFFPFRSKRRDHHTILQPFRERF